MLIRIMGKGKMPLLAAVGEGIVRTSGIFQGISPAKMAVRGRNTRRAIFGKCIGESVEGSRRSCRIKHRVHVHMLRHSFATLLEQGNGPEEPYRSCWDTTTSRLSIYLHVTSAHKSSILNPLDSLITHNVQLVKLQNQNEK